MATPSGIPQIQDDSPLPHRVADQLCSMIISGALKPGSRLTNELELAKSLNVSRSTLRAALDRLASQGLVVRKRGIGTFVADEPLVTNNLSINFGVTQVIKSVGAKPGTAEVYLNVEKAGERVAERLELELASPVVVIERVRTADDRPVVLSFDIIPQSLLDTLRQRLSLDEIKQFLIKRQSLYALLIKQLGLEIDHGIARLHPIVAERWAAEKLGVPARSGLLHIEQVDYDPYGRPVMLSDEYHVANTFTFTVYRQGGLTLAACAPSEAENWEKWETIKIGVPTLITGHGASMGADILAGISMSVEKVNSEGGVLGKPLEMIITDTKESGAEECRLAAEFMSRSDVVANFPGAFYGPACIHEFGKYDQPLFHGSAIKETVDAVVANLPEYRNIFQVSASEESFGINAYEVMVNELPYDFPNKKAALLGGDITYDMLIKEGMRKQAEENGWEIVMDDTYPYGTTEFGAQLAKIRAEEPAVIFACITSVDTSVAFVNQFLQNPTNSLILIQWSPVAAEFKGLLAEKANGILWQTEYAYLPTPENQVWVEEFEAKFGRSPGAAWPAMMDDMLHIWKAAIESCGSPVDYECIYEYLENLSDHPYEGREGTYGMDPERHESLTGAEWIPIHVYQIQDQKDVLLYLGTDAFEGNSFQVPPWFQE